MRISRLVALAGAGLLASSAASSGAPQLEMEGNNAFATANHSGPLQMPLGAVAWDGSISIGDVDYFTFDMLTQEYFTGYVFDRTPEAFDADLSDGNEGTDNDSLMGVFFPGGVPHDRDDDSGPGLLSTYHFRAFGSGRHGIAISGFGDVGFSGSGHTENYNYKFVAATSNTLVENEAGAGNGTYASANPIPAGAYPTGAVAIGGALSTGDVDYFTFFFNAGDYVTSAIFDLTTDPLPPDGDVSDGNENGDSDSLLGIFGPGGVLLDSDDDAGAGRTSAHHFIVPTTGLYAFAVSGFGDPNFDGVGHSEAFEYRLLVGINPIPGPAGASVLAIAGAAMLRRRRNG